MHLDSNCEKKLSLLSLQTLCTECGQKLSDAELKMVKQEPVAKKMAILEQQYEALQVRSLANHPSTYMYRLDSSCNKSCHFIGWLEASI